MRELIKQEKNYYKALVKRVAIPSYFGGSWNHHPNPRKLYSWWFILFFWNHSVISNFVGKNTKTQDINSSLWLLLFGWKLNKLVLFSTLALNSFFFFTALLSAFSRSLLDAPVKCQCIWENFEVDENKLKLYLVFSFLEIIFCKVWTRYCPLLSIRLWEISSFLLWAQGLQKRICALQW